MVWVVNAKFRPLYPRYLLYSWLGVPQGRSGRVRQISSPPGFDPRTFQSVASRTNTEVKRTETPQTANKTKSTFEAINSRANSSNNNNKNIHNN
jgi:hypothetical protein